MGTWGAGPFDSDMAEDFVDQLEDVPSSRRVALIRTRLEQAVSDDAEKLLGEVLAAAAVVAAGLPAGRDLPWNEDYPGIASWLPEADVRSLAALADRALEAHFPPDGWYWQSWTDDEERDEARAVYERLRQVLRE
jgi:alpha-glucosidase